VRILAAANVVLAGAIACGAGAVGFSIYEVAGQLHPGLGIAGALAMIVRGLVGLIGLIDFFVE
jgi:hypothetical protein